MPNQISSPVKPSAPQNDHNGVTKKDDVGSTSNLTATAFYTANQSASLYPTLSDASQECKVNDQPLEVSRKRRSSSISSAENKKACIATSPTKVQRPSQSWFSQFLRK